MSIYTFLYLTPLWECVTAIYVNQVIIDVRTHCDVSKCLAYKCLICSLTNSSPGQPSFITHCSLLFSHSTCMSLSQRSLELWIGHACSISASALCFKTDRQFDSGLFIVFHTCSHSADCSLIRLLMQRENWAPVVKHCITTTFSVPALVVVHQIREFQDSCSKFVQTVQHIWLLIMVYIAKLHEDKLLFYLFSSTVK